MKILEHDYFGELVLENYYKCTFKINGCKNYYSQRFADIVFHPIDTNSKPVLWGEYLIDAKDSIDDLKWDTVCGSGCCHIWIKNNYPRRELDIVFESFSDRHETIELKTSKGRVFFATELRKFYNEFKRIRKIFNSVNEIKIYKVDKNEV